MAPHLMRAQGAYKADKHARPTHAHTPTNNPQRWVFSFDLKEESVVACLTEKEREF